MSSFKKQRRKIKRIKKKISEGLIFPIKIWLGVILAVGLIIGGFRFVHLHYLKVKSLYVDAISLKESGEQEDALELFQEVIAIDQDYKDAYLQYFELLIALDPEKSYEELEPIANRSDAEHDFKRLLIENLIVLNNPTLAVPIVKELIQNDKEHVQNLILGGRIAYTVRDYKTAVVWLNQARKKAPDDEELEYYLALSLSWSDQLTDRVVAKAKLMRLAEDSRKFSFDSIIELLVSGRFTVFREDQAKLISFLTQESDYLSSIKALPIDSLRRIVGAMVLVSPADAFDIMKIIVKDDSADEEDRIQFIHLGQNLREARAVEKLVIEFEEDFPEDPAILNLAARQRFITENIEGGIATLRKVLELEPDNQTVLDTAFAMFTNQGSDLSIGQKNAFLELIIEHPNSTFAQKFIAYNALLHLRPTRKNQILDTATDEFGETNLVGLAGWFNRIGEYERVLKLLTDEKCDQNHELIQIRFYALLHSKQYNEATQFLAHCEPKLSRLDAAYMHCLLSGHQRDFEVAHQYWHQAFKYAQDENDRFYLLALSRLNGLFKDASVIAKAYSTALRAGATLTARDWEIYFAAIAQDGDIQKLIEVCSSAVEFFPNNSLFLNNYYYFSFLMGEELEEGVVAMSDLIKKNPNQTAFKLTLALGYHRLGQAKKALNLIEDSQLNFAADGAAEQVLYAAVLAANGRSSMASSIAENIDHSRLMQQESELIAGLGAELQDSSSEN